MQILSYLISPADSTSPPPTLPPALIVHVYDSQGNYIETIYDTDNPPLTNTLYYNTSGLVAGSYFFIFFFGDIVKAAQFIKN